MVTIKNSSTESFNLKVQTSVLDWTMQHFHVDLPHEWRVHEASTSFFLPNRFVVVWNFFIPTSIWKPYFMGFLKFIMHDLQCERTNLISPAISNPCFKLSKAYNASACLSLKTIIEIFEVKNIWFNGFLSRWQTWKHQIRKWYKKNMRLDLPRLQLIQLKNLKSLILYILH